MIASTMNSSRIDGNAVPRPKRRSFTRSLNSSGKPVTAVVPRMPTAIPRNRASEPIVTASDGRPTTVMRKPLTAPPMTPTRTAIAIAAGSGVPAWKSAPMITLESPTMLATDRSISPVMMMNVIGSAMSSTGNTSRIRK